MSVLKGNYAFRQGEYQKALVCFLQQEGKGSYDEIISYNIGTVYYALGEGSSALKLWEASEERTDKHVLFAVNFNSGIVLYQNGLFGKAYYAFKRALEIKPASLDAKKNLELSLERLEAESRSRKHDQNPGQKTLSDDAGRILQYVKRKEESRWDSGISDSTEPRDW